MVAATDDAEAQLTRLRESRSAPADPDAAWVDDWLHPSCLAYRATG